MAIGCAYILVTIHGAARVKEHMHIHNPTGNNVRPLVLHASSTLQSQVLLIRKPLQWLVLVSLSIGNTMLNCITVVPPSSLAASLIYDF